MFSGLQCWDNNKGQNDVSELKECSASKSTSCFIVESIAHNEWFPESALIIRFQKSLRNQFHRRVVRNLEAGQTTDIRSPATALQMGQLAKNVVLSLFEFHSRCNETLEKCSGMKIIASFSVIIAIASFYIFL